MRTAQDIYREYRILPSLQLHQLRVAAVGKAICDSFKQSINTEAVILAGLFHDMGNIIKSDLSYFPEFTKSEGIEYWEKIKAEFLQKYGADHHRANSAIAREIGIPNTAADLIDSIGFSKLETVVSSASYEQKIIQYGDLRVGPHGVLLMEERLNEGRQRYLSRKSSKKTGNTEAMSRRDGQYEHLVEVAKKLEQQIFANVTIVPGDITDSKISDDVEKLRNFPVA